MDVFYVSYPVSGSPEGLITANAGALFLAAGSYNKINYSGTGSWIDITYKARRIPSSREIPNEFGGTYIYTKTTNGTNTGWKFLTSGSFFF
jgi:hypothetical protein